MLFYGDPAPDADLVVLYGNCQTPFLASLLAAANGDKGYLCVLNHGPSGQEVERPTPEQMGRCRLYLEQYDSQPDLPPWGEAVDLHRYGPPLRRYLRGLRPAGCPTLTFPSFIMTCLWPFIGLIDPRNHPEPGYVWGRYPFCDRLALELLDRGLCGQAALDAYHRLSADRRPDPQVALAQARRKLETRDAQCDVQIADYVWATFRERHLFLSYAHVRAEAIGVLARRLFAKAQPLLGGDADAAWARLEAAIAVLPDMDALEAPIEPAVAQELGLAFHQPDMRFNWFGQRWTFDEYLARYLAYDRNW